MGGERMVRVGSEIRVGCKTGVRLAAGDLVGVAVSGGMTSGMAAVGICVGNGAPADPHPAKPSTISISPQKQILLTIFTENGRNARETVIPIHIGVFGQQNGDSGDILGIQPIGAVTVDLLIR